MKFKSNFISFLFCWFVAVFRAYLLLVHVALAGDGMVVMCLNVQTRARSEQKYSCHGELCTVVNKNYDFVGF